MDKWLQESQKDTTEVEDMSEVDGEQASEGEVLAVVHRKRAKRRCS